MMYLSGKPTGKDFMKKNVKGLFSLGRLYNLLGIASVALKITADYRRHAACERKTGGEPNLHGQRCHCFQQCLPCLTAAARGE
jgi:hypothetical protein